MKRKYKVLLSIFILLIALFYLFSPPRHLSIKIAVHHISTFNYAYLDYYLQSNDIDSLRKSVEVIDLLFDQRNQSLKQNNIALFVSKRWVSKELYLMNDAYKEIHEKVN